MESPGAFNRQGSLRPQSLDGDVGHREVPRVVGQKNGVLTPGHLRDQHVGGRELLLVLMQDTVAVVTGSIRAVESSRYLVSGRAQTDIQRIYRDLMYANSS
jgi:hypothetical protein